MVWHRLRARMFCGTRSPGWPLLILTAWTGELRNSLSIRGANEVGYSKEYAKPVEFGHRTRGGGYRAGRYYLKANIEIERPIFRRRVLDAIRRAGGGR